MDTFECLECTSDSVLVISNGICVYSIPYCIFYNYQNGDCLECEEGYLINGESKC